MTEGDARLHHLAGAILDITAIDWAKAESGADESIRHLIRELKVIADIVVVHAAEPCGPVFVPTPSESADSDAGLGCWGPLRLLQKIGEVSAEECCKWASGPGWNRLRG